MPVLRLCQPLWGYKLLGTEWGLFAVVNRFHLVTGGREFLQVRVAANTVNKGQKEKHVWVGLRG